MTDRPPDVVAFDNDQPSDQEPTTNRRPTDHTPLSLEEAADQLGITVNAVRQRIKRGTVHGEKTSAGWVVFLSTDQVTTTDPSRRPTDRPVSTPRQPTNQPVDQGAIAPLADLIADLTRENRDLAAAAALWQERARFLGERLQAIEAGPMPADVAGDQTPQEVMMTPPRDEPPTPEPEETERPWWRRLADRLGGS